MTNVEDFTEKAKAVLYSLKESFDNVELLRFAPEVPEEILDDVISAETQFDDPVEYEIIDDEPAETFSVDGDIKVPEDEMLDHGESIQTSTMSVPFEEAPKFRIYWRAWKEGNSTSGQTESKLETAQMARAEAMTKLYDLGFTDLEILAIETIKSEEQPESQI